MARKTPKMTDKKIESYIQEGRGQGEGAKYIPWLKIGNFSSKGRGHRIKDPKSGREHHFFSDLEADYFWHLVWNDQIVDIREQYPLLPVEETEQIAQLLGYRYPQEPGENTRHVMTTDYLLTVRDPDGEHYVARHVKYAKDLDNPRTVEKFEIEQRYWANRGIPLKVVTEQSFNRRRAKNISFLMGYHSPLPQLGDSVICSQIANRIYELISTSAKYQRLNSLMMSIDNQFDLPTGTALSLFFHLASHKEIPLKMTQQLSGTLYLNDIIDWEEYKAQQKEVLSHARYG